MFLTTIFLQSDIAAAAAYPPSYRPVWQVTFVVFAEKVLKLESTRPFEYRNRQRCSDCRHGQTNRENF